MTDQSWEDLLLESEGVESDAERQARRLDEDCKEAAVTRKITMASWHRSVPTWLMRLVHSMSTWTNVRWDRVRDSDGLGGDESEDGGVPDFSDGRIECSLPSTEVLGSKMPGDYQILALDLDTHAALIPSSTAGHHHLIINTLLDDEGWREILTVLGKHGILEQGYVDVSLKRGQTFIRAPWIRKGHEVPDRIAAYSSWVELAPEHDYTAGAQQYYAWLATQTGDTPPTPDVVDADDAPLLDVF